MINKTVGISICILLILILWNAYNIRKIERKLNTLTDKKDSKGKDENK